jgi:hypothetical protein
MNISLLYILINNIHHIIILPLYNILAIMNKATKIKKSRFGQTLLCKNLIFEHCITSFLPPCLESSCVAVSSPADTIPARSYYSDFFLNIYTSVSNVLPDFVLSPPFCVRSVICTSTVVACNIIHEIKERLPKSVQV